MATIVVTGANRGIGLELARQYAAQGHEVIRTMRGADKAEMPIGTAMALDVTDAASVARFAAALAGKPVDLLVNNAGVSGPARQSATDMDFDGFGQVIAANVFGPLRVTQALLPNLRGADGAKVAVVSSRMGSLTLAQGGSVAYRTSKAAVNMVFKLLAGELKGEGMSVVMLHPGVTFDEVQEATGFALEAAAEIRTTPAPTTEQLAIIARLDPHNVRAGVLKDNPAGKRS